MSVVITKEDLISYAEVDYIINHMNERYRSMLPQNLLTFFETMKDPEHEIYIDPHKPLQNQGLTKYTLEIIAILHVKYWCENQERKEELLEKMRKNQERFDQKLREQFNAENLFNNNNNQEQDDSDKLEKAYEKYMNQNPDIQDFTDLREEQETTELPQKSLSEKTSIFKRIQNFFTRIFRKSTD